MDSWVHKNVGSHRMMTASLVTAFTQLMMASHEGTSGRKTQQGRLGYGVDNRKKPCALVYPRVYPSKRTEGRGK